MKSVKQSPIIIAPIIIMLIFSACSIYLNDSDAGNVSITIGSANERTAAPDWLGAFELEDLIHTVQVFDADGAEQHSVDDLRYGDTSSFSVNPGLYTFQAKAFYNGDLVAIGSAERTIRSGANPAVIIKMEALPVQAPLDLEGTISIVNDDGVAITEPVLTGTKLTAVYSGTESGVNFQWKKEQAVINGATSATYTPTVSGEYTVTVSLAGYSSKTSSIVTVTNEIRFYVSNQNELNGALTLIKEHSISSSIFVIIFTSNIEIDPHNLDDTDYANKIITLRGNTADRTITLSSQGSMFTIGTDVELILEDITLHGRSDNNTSLIKVNTDGKLVLNDGGKVTGNTYNTSVNRTGGAGVFVDGGILEITGGEISENNLSTTIGTISIYGGGVFAVNNSTVLMSGGTIRYNSVRGVHTSHGQSHGGGIAISDSTFEMISGIIEGNTAYNEVTSGGDCYAIGGGVRIVESTTIGSSFYLRNGIIRNNSCTAITASMGIAGGGGIFIGEGNNLVMSGGIISGNNCESTSNPNYYNGQYTVGAYGGGVCLWGDDKQIPFVKTGGIIYDNNAVGNDDDGFPLMNTAQSDSSGLGGGYAVFFRKGSAATDIRRNSTAYETDNMDSSVSGLAGGWD